LDERQRPVRASKKFVEEPLDGEEGPAKLRVVATQESLPTAVGRPVIRE
jgi:hypothetical protein